MTIFTFQIGDGDGQTITHLAHSESLDADEVMEAIALVKTKAKARAASDRENTVRLLEAAGDNGLCVWARSINDL